MNITKEAKERALKVTKQGGGWSCDGLPTDDPDYYFKCRDREANYDPSPWAEHALKFWSGRFICLECQKEYLAEDLENAPTLQNVFEAIDIEDPMALMSNKQKRWSARLEIFIKREETEPHNFQIVMQASDNSWQMQTMHKYHTPEVAFAEVKGIIRTIETGWGDFSLEKLRLIKQDKMGHFWRVR